MEENLKKIIRKIVNEALGVPDNIYETAISVYDDLVSQLSWSTKDSVDSEDGEEFHIKLPLRIADYVLPTIRFQVSVKEHPKAKDFENLHMAISSESEKPDDDNLKMRIVKSDPIKIKSLFVAPEDFEMSDFLEYLKREKNEIVENLSHELKHAYDHYKKEFESPIQRAEYNAYAGRSFGIPSVDLFFHDLYFVTASENLVRPTEVVSAIKNNNISQKNFIDFLKNNTTYITLKRIKNFNLEQFREKLKNDMKHINRLLKHLGNDVATMSDDEKIDEILRLIYVNLGNWKGESLKDILTSNFFEELIGFQGEKNKMFNRFVNKVSKFKDYKEFFDYETKNFHFIADKMIKKIAKVYDMTGKSKEQ